MTTAAGIITCYFLSTVLPNVTVVTIGIWPTTCASKKNVGSAW